MYFFRNTLSAALVATAVVSTGVVGATLVSGLGSYAQAQSASSFATALANELQRGGKAMAEIRDYYGATGYKPIWVTNQRKASSLIKLVATGRDHAIPVAAFGVEKVVAQIKAAKTDPARAKAEVAASALFVRFGRALGSGYLRPRSVDEELHIFPTVRSVKTLLDAARKSSSVARLEKGLMPKSKEYAALRKERTALAKIVRNGDWGAKIPGGKTLRPGQSSNRVVAMRARLAKMGARNLGTSAVYDDKLVAAVRNFQETHGLNADGVAGPATLSAINASASDRLAQVIVNMERARWMNRDLGQRHITVNLADFTMELIDNGRPIFESRVVIGTSKEHRTPEFSKDMTHMVINPTWHVPSSIASKELLPKLKADVNYLNKRNMRLINRAGNVVNPRNINLAGYSEGNFPYRIKQAPDRGNALGRVKFMFPNRFAIYLHDTPAKKLFGRDTRAFSHGCVRVAKPFELAYALLKPQYGGKSEATFKSILNTGKERYVNLDTAVPVHLTYRSVVVGKRGDIEYRGDVYGRDAKVFRALVKAGLAVGGAAG